MANEITYALISSLVNPIWEGALMYAQYNFVMPRLVTTFSDYRGMVDRKVTEYAETAVTDNIAETDDLSNVAFTRALLSTLTPKEIGKQFIITDRRIDTDPESIMADAAMDIGYTIGKKVELDLMSNFSSLTGGVFGDEGNAMSMDLLWKARARLEAQGVPGPYVAVIHSYHWLDIFSSFTSLSNAAPLDIRNQAQRSYFVQNVADMQIVISSLLPKTKVADEKQTITVTGTPTGGTFKLKFAGAETAAIAYNASAANVVTALEALGNIGTGGVTATGGALPGTAVVVTFADGTFKGDDVPLMTLSNNSLTGGTTPTVTIAETVKGSNYATGAVFNRQSLALDLRRGLRIEPDRDPSKRSTELNATMIYAHGVWRPKYGVIVKADVSSPLN